MKYVERFFSNFYSRNVAGFLLLWGYGRIYGAEFYPDFSWGDLLFLDLFMVYVFTWMIFHNQILLKKILQKGKVLLYIGCLLLGGGAWLFMDKILSQQGNLYYNLVFGTTQFVWYTLIATTGYFAMQYMQKRKSSYEYAIIQRETELQQLKAQLNPHFLFNALNNIYSYNQENDDHGNELIIKLSQLMRYVVEVSKKSTVPIGEECKFISNYVDFEKERLGHRCDIHLQINISDENMPISPMLFFPLIENAFKFGAASNANSTVNINICQKVDHLSIEIKNSIPGSLPNDSTHTGLTNAKRRLELLYPNSHEWKVGSENGLFTAYLKLQLR